ncbi:MAG: PQQ-like beta-propeller repeat protein [Bryobacteraceae bacterium]|nr:PQQ-like beta-propeller repeat protein [Bryobacteraceae bacterium]
MQQILPERGSGWKIFPALLGAMALAGAAAAADWPQLQCDAARSGFQPGEILATNRHTNSNPAGYGAPAWAWNAPEALSGQPVVAQGIVAIGTVRGRVFALDERTGAVRWTADAGAPVFATLAIADGKVIVPTQRGELLALAANSGQQVWVYRGARKGYSASPAVAGGRIYVGSKDGRMHAVDLASGQAAWVFEVGGPGDAGAERAAILASAAVLDGRVYFGAENLFAYALDANTGARLWRRRLHGQSFSWLWPVASRQAGGVVIFRTTPVYSHGQMLIDDEYFLQQATGVSDATQSDGTPQQWLAEQRAISQRLRNNPHRRSFWVLRASDGQDRYSMPEPVLWTSGSGDAGAPPVVDDASGRAWMTARSAWARFDGMGVRPFGDLNPINLGGFDPAVYSDGNGIENRLFLRFFRCASPHFGCKEAWEDFHKISDEFEVLTATPNAVVVANWVSVGGVDLATHRTFNIRFYSTDDTGAAGLYGTHVGAVIANGRVVLRDTAGLKSYAIPR